MTTAFHAPAGATDLPIEDIPEVLTQGGDWDDVLHEIEAITSERIVVNLGPVHPATHGVLRLILELDGEKVRETRIDTGYLHTGIEKNMEYRTWAQGVAWTTSLPSSRKPHTASALRSSSASKRTSPSARPSSASS